jgi:hypothetical protein
MSNNMDREYVRGGVLPNWLQEFADKELKKGGNPFDDIRELFKSKDDVEAVEARVNELRSQVGLDVIEKIATIKHVERAKEHGKGTTKKWCVYPKGGGKALGCHESKEGAQKQLQAIEINKAMDGCYIQEIEDGETEKKAKLLINLVAFAQALEDEGMLKAAALVDEKIKSLQNDPLLAKDKDVKELPKKYEKYDGLDEFIQNACRTSGGHASVPAIQDRIRKEFDDELDVKNKDLEDYIKYCLKEHEECVPENTEHAGEYIAIIVTDDNDGNQKVFDDPAGIK